MWPILKNFLRFGNIKLNSKNVKTYTWIYQEQFFLTFFFKIQSHSSLLSVFGLNANSTYKSYLPWIFGKFALIWGHFQNILTSRFRGRWGRRGHTTSKSKTMEILNENLLKLDEIQILASATSKMTSWPQRPRKGLSGFFQKIHF